MAQQPAGWYTDPTSAYDYRYWDGTQWSNQVSSGGSTATDPNPMDPGTAATPPAPGTAAPAPSQQQPVQTVQVTQSRGSAFGTIIGVVLAIVAVVVLIVVLMNASGGDSTNSTVAPPASTVETTPATTAGG